MRTILDRLATEAPIWNAGMLAGLAGPALTAAVCEHGGLGTLGLSALPESSLFERIEQTRHLTSRPFAANVILSLSDGLEIEICMDARIAVLVLFDGDPQPWIRDAHRRDMFVVMQCGTVEDAIIAADLGVDAVIMQGLEAGGPVRARASLIDNLSLAARSLGRTVPVLAAGGLATGADAAAALREGAGAAVLGTRFLATQEAEAAAVYKQALLRATAEDTEVTRTFSRDWPGMDHRVLRNAASDSPHVAEDATAPAPTREEDAIGRIPWDSEHRLLFPQTYLPPTTAFDGDPEQLPWYAGTSVTGIDDLPAAGALMERLMLELRAAYR
jgi:NAD(P)H-dependent flavin oxidoreductase YrpB (nitropropane dioxygenase family)